MIFWTLAALGSLVVAAFLLRALSLGAGRQSDGGGFDVQVYRDQLAEVDRDVARGVLDAEDAERTKTEISRRLIAAHAAAKASAAGAASEKTELRLGFGIVAAVVVAGGLALYHQLGQPLMPDQPLAERLAEARELASTRPSQEAYEASLPARPDPNQDPDLLNLVKQLRDVVQDRPDDLRGFELLARNEASLGNFKRAYQAQERIIELKGDAAEPNDHLSLADYYMISAEGYISPEAEVALRKALELSPQNGFARYYTGLLMMQTGRPDLTFRFWRALLEEGPENAPWIAPIRENIEDLAWIAGVRYDPPAPRGPSAADIAAAENMDSQDRAAMIEGMVSSLSERLATEGGSAQEWAQLITALAVLGRTGDAGDIWAEAQEIFAEAPAALDLINQAAQTAGLAE
jgi:cytochrome c-type biogenesis protein CcmH